MQEVQLARMRVHIASNSKKLKKTRKAYAIRPIPTVPDGSGSP